MTTPPDNEVTRLLGELGAGDASAAELLLPLLHGELRGIAGHLMRGQPAGHTLQPTALVNEAWMKLGARNGASYTDRAHFLRVAARAMRSVLVDHARGKQRLKRGNGTDVATGFFDQHFELADDRRLDVLALHEALEHLSGVDPAAVEVVELRFFAGLTVPETAAALEVSDTTVERKWRLTRAWLRERIA
jgi:RNA polymerase sigma factor (TIGR02999 family)